MPITETQLAEQIEAAFDAEADQVVNPAEARKRVAQKIAAAVAQFTVGRTTTVTMARMKTRPLASPATPVSLLRLLAKR